MLSRRPLPARPEERPQDERRHQHVVQLSRHGDEVRHEVEREREIREQARKEELVPPGNAAVAKQAGGQNGAVGDEARKGPRILAAPDDDEERDERGVDQQGDAERDEQPGPPGHGRKL